MNWKIAAPVAACLTLGSIHPAMAQHHHWGYSGEGAPQNWGKLDPEFATCASGKSQSPIDLGKSTKGNPTPVRLDYKKGTTEILNNGHTVQVNYQPGSALAAWFRQRVGTLQGRTRRIAIVAMARKLLIALWRYVETGVTPDGMEIRAEADVTA